MAINSETISALCKEAGLSESAVYEIVIDPLSVTFKFYNRDGKGNFFVDKEEISKSQVVHELLWQKSPALTQ